MQNFINFNGRIIKKSSVRLGLNNDFFKNGLILSEKLVVLNHKILFAEEHYFNLMAAMRMSRIEIPLNFTPEYFEQQINLIVEEYPCENLSINFQVHYDETRIHYTVEAVELKSFYEFKTYNIDLYREAYIGSTFFDRVNFLSPVNHILDIYCKENDFDDLFLQNNSKQLARTLRGSIFLINGTELITPKIEDGAKDSVLRNKVLTIANKLPEFDKVAEENIFPFAVMKTEELFVAIDDCGIISIKNYKKSQYANDYTKSIVNAIIESI